MPAYNFKERFVPMVQDRSKRQTIRPFRPHPTKPGQLAHLFTGMRTKWCLKLVDPAPVITDVKCIAIHNSTVDFPFGRLLLIHKGTLDKEEYDALMSGADTLPDVAVEELEGDERNTFAYNDGFRFPESSNIQPWIAMRCWWGQNYRQKVWIGNVIYW